MNDIRTFTDNRFGEIRTVMMDGEPWFVAADICDYFGVTNRNRVMRQLDDDEKGGTQMTTPGGTQTVSIVNEAGLYSLLFALQPTKARGVSDEYVEQRSAELRAFKRWITHEVLPTIRKHGAYATPETLDRILGDPDFGIRLLSELKTEREKRLVLEETAARQEQLLTEMEPKVSYLDTILQNKKTVPVTAIAKDYGMSARAMNNLLHKRGVQYRLGSMWVLYQSYADKGYTQSATELARAGKVVMYTCWTQKGRLFLYNLLKDSYGLLPMIEREAMHDEGFEA